jgi:hypothetical protein
MTKKIDIIASVFNCDDFIEGYFIDITSQTFFKYSNLILVAPNPSEKVKKTYSIYKKIYDNITLIELESDPGISKCLNIAIDNGSSEYITIANTDDRKRKDSLERHSLELDLNEGVDLVYGISLVSFKPNETFDFNTCNSIYPCQDFTGLEGLIRNNSPHNNPMWRRSMNERNGAFDETLEICADFDLWLKCVLNGSKFKKINEVLGIYYKNPNGMSTKASKLDFAIQEVQRVAKKYIQLKNEQASHN